MSTVVIGTGVVGITIYLILRILHAGLHEFKQIFFLNSKNIVLAVILADVYVVFDVLCIKAISSANIYVSCAVMVIATTLSISSAMIYQAKNLKEYIYTYEITTKYPKLRFELKDKFKALNIPYEYQYYYFENDKDNNEERAKGIEINEFGEALYHRYLIHCFTKEHSKQLEKILSKYDYKEVKYMKTNTSNYIERKEKNEQRE